MKYCTPEIDILEVIVDLQWHFPMDFQWHFPTEVHFSAVFSEGLSLPQWISTGIICLRESKTFLLRRYHHNCVCVIYTWLIYYVFVVYAQSPY